MRRSSVMAGAMLFLATTAYATDAGDTRALVATARQRVESEDSRATGHLVRVDGGGKRISNDFAIKAHWFPGVLRVLLEIVPSYKPGEDVIDGVSQNAPQDSLQNVRPGSRHDARVSILLEMRPNGLNKIQVFRAHESVPVSLPFDKWSEGVVGTDFNYEDFLQSELYWQNQAFLKSAKIGAHDCDVLKSTPGAADRSHYFEVQTSFDHTIGFPLYVEKTLKDGGVVKEFTSFGLRQVDGVWSARQVEVKTHGHPGSTLLIFERGSTKAKLTLKDFSPAQIGQ